MKKGQVTPFIVVGIVILILIGVIFFLNTNDDSTAKSLTGVLCVEDAVDYLEECVEEETLESFEIMLEQGGYITLEERSDFNTAYGYNENITLPEIHEMEDELSTYLNRNIPSICSEKVDVDISDAPIETNVELDTSAMIEVIWTPTITCGDGYNGDLGEVTLDLNMDFEEYYETIYGLLERGDSTPLVINENYAFNQTYNEDYSESLIEVYTGDFVFKTGILINNENQ